MARRAPLRNSLGGNGAGLQSLEDPVVVAENDGLAQYQVRVERYSASAK
jgi:hypothetical protein